MAKLTKQQYLDALLRQSVTWISGSLASPSPSMRPIHIALHRIALRRKGVSA